MEELTRVDVARADVAGSDEWWLRKLSLAMNARPKRPSSRTVDSRRYDYTRNEWLNVLWSYHIGEPPLDKLSLEWGKATREFLRRAKTGYAGLVSQALLERIQFVGVRSVSSETADVDGDDDVRRILAANAAAISDALEYAVVMGEGYLLVGRGGTAGALLSAEDPRSMIVSTDPVTGEVRAALKIYLDEDLDEEVAALYVLDDAEKQTAHQTTFVRPASGANRLAFKAWTYADESRNATLVQGVGVPVVPVHNKLRMGEAEKHLDLIDRIYGGIADRLWAVKYQVFIQRAVKGNLPSVDADGNPIDYDDLFASDPGALWELPDGVDLWESRQINVQEVLLPTRDDIRELAATSQTPLPTLLAESQNGSAEGATLAREGVSFKAEDRISRWGPAMVRVAQLSLAYAGKAVPEELEPMFAPVERLSLAQRMAAARDAKQAGVPTAAIWADVVQMPPATVKRWQDMHDEEVLFAGVGES